jgi:Rieske Fe-S protein
LLTGTGTGVVAVAAAAGFVVTDRLTGEKSTGTAAPQTPSTPQPPAAEKPPAAPAPGAPDGRKITSLDKLDDGGVVLDNAKLVVTRDADGQVHGFSAVCTHQGCLVASFSGGTINCPCHGSKFDAGTGAPVAGPANRPLAPIALEVVGNDVVMRQPKWQATA